MLGYMAARAATGAVSAATRNGTDPKDVKPAQAGPFAVIIVVALMAVVVIAAMANGGQVTWIITPIAVIAGLVVLGGMFASGASEAHRANQKLRSMPNPEDQLHERAQVRAALERRKTAVTGTPAPCVPQTASPARPAMVSLKELQAEADDNERCVRMAQIMLAPCPTCTVPGSGLCTFHPGQEVTILDRERNIIVHTSRIGNAVKTRNASVEDVKAQFGGNIPASVWSWAL